jgi:hypothetical protein
VCARGELQLYNQYFHIISGTPHQNIVFLETKNNYSGNKGGGMDDFIFWTTAIAFSAFTSSEVQVIDTADDVHYTEQVKVFKELVFDVNNYTYEKPNLLLITNDTQKTYDVDTSSNTVKNLKTELSNDVLLSVFINNEDSKELWYMLISVQYILVNSKDISKYNNDTYGFYIAEKCNGFEIDYSNNNIHYDANLNNVIDRIYDSNCTNFEKFISLVKYLQIKYFGGNLSLDENFVSSFINPLNFYP